MQRRTPLTVLHVGLASGQIARLTAVDHAHLQSGRLEHAIQRQPVHPSGLHCYRAHALCLEPVAQRVQLRGDGTEHLGRAARHGHMHLLAADVHERGARIKDRQIAHVDAPDRVKTAMPRRKPGRVQGMTDLSNGKRCSPKCATARDRSQSTYRAVGRTKGLSGHAARGKTPQEQQ